MKLLKQSTLLQEIRRHISAKAFDFMAVKVEPYVRVYKTDSALSKRQFRLYDEETYNEVVNTAIRARKANPADIKKAGEDFCTLVKAIERPSVEPVYTLMDVADNTGYNTFSVYNYLNRLEQHPFQFIESDCGRVKLLDRDNFLKAIEFAQKTGPKERPFKPKEKTQMKQAAVQKAQPLFETKYASSQYVHECIKEKFNLGSRTQCRAFMNRLLDFVPHYTFLRGINTEVIYDLAVADKFNEAAKSSESIAELTRKLVSLFTEAPKKKLYSLTEISEQFGVSRNDHDREEVRMLASSLGIGGALVNDQPTIFFTEDEKETILKSHNCKIAQIEAPAPKDESGSVSVSVNGITFTLSRTDALKLAQSILGQIEAA